MTRSSPAVMAPASRASCSSKANDDRIGMLGLWELENAGDAPPPDVPETGFAPVRSCCCSNTPELNTVFPLPPLPCRASR